MIDQQTLDLLDDAIVAAEDEIKQGLVRIKEILVNLKCPHCQKEIIINPERIRETLVDSFRKEIVEHLESIEYKEKSDEDKQETENCGICEKHE